MILKKNRAEQGQNGPKVSKDCVYFRVKMVYSMASPSNDKQIEIVGKQQQIFLMNLKTKGFCC